MKNIVLVSGGFDPLHSGHIAYINAARKLGEVLVVGLNSDAWLIRKKGKYFLPYAERECIIENISAVDFVVQFNDDDGTASDLITCAREMFPDDHLIMANGGDRTSDNIPEMGYEDDNLEFMFGIGGEDKKNSSSWILQEWKDPKIERQWGYYRVLYETPNVKVKELVVQPGKSLSMQRHKYRNEHWHVSEGTASVIIKLPVNPNEDDKLEKNQLFLNHTMNIPPGRWHQLFNETNTPCKIVEIQYGVKCIEEDIERK